MILNVDEINYNVHHFEEDNFERFDEIYDCVLDGDVDFEEDDIIKLCSIFLEPFDEIHPHQYMKIYRITFSIINKVGIELGFKKLIEGLLLLPETCSDYIEDYLKMIFNGYSIEEIEYLKRILSDFQIRKTDLIYKTINLIFEKSSDSYSECKKVFKDNDNF